MPTIRPSNDTLARSLSPRTDSCFEFEIWAQCEHAYTRLLPPVTQDLTEALRTVPPYRPVPTMAELRVAGSLPLIYYSSTGGRDRFELPLVESERTVQGPNLPRTFCDDRLHKLDIGYWSMVPIQNELAASLISFYIETDHSYLGLLDTDLFLEDIIYCRQRFCSPFLVSAVLYNASHKYVAVEPR
jgi:hypothetical protein